MERADQELVDGIRGVTERDRVWIDRLERIEAEGIAAKDYAAREGFSRHALYQAKKRLRQQGAWPKATGRVAKPRFARVRLVEAPPAAAMSTSPFALRLRLPSGAMLEWSAMPRAEELGAVLERVRVLR